MNERLVWVVLTIKPYPWMEDGSIGVLRAYDSYGEAFRAAGGDDRKVSTVMVPVDKPAATIIEVTTAPILFHGFTAPHRIMWKAGARP